MMVFDDYPRLATEFMNQEHAEFAELVNQLEQGLQDGQRMESEMQALVEHVKDHFAHEEQEMQSVGFPPYPVHKGEHDRVITLFEQQLAYYREASDNEPLLNFIREDVPAWFEQHLNTMDMVTARFLAMHQL
ncbi:MAG: hemerythrin family protein [Oceanobacter sp.]|jgi:hemerythrin